MLLLWIWAVVLNKYAAVMCVSWLAENDSCIR
jgi:hypothetical protein